MFSCRGIFTLYIISCFYFLQAGGVLKIHPIGPVSAFEQKLLDAAVPELKANIAKGVEFVKKSSTH